MYKLTAFVAVIIIIVWALLSNYEENPPSFGTSYDE